MKAIRIHSLGGPEVLQLEDIPAPQPKEGEAIVRIEAAGLNFIDCYFRSGLYKGPALPFTLGQEAAGVVAAPVSPTSPWATGWPTPASMGPTPRWRRCRRRGW